MVPYIMAPPSQILCHCPSVTDPLPWTPCHSFSVMGPVTASLSWAPSQLLCHGPRHSFSVMGPVTVSMALPCPICHGRRHGPSVTYGSVCHEHPITRKLSWALTHIFCHCVPLSQILCHCPSVTYPLSCPPPCHSFSVMDP